MKKYYLILGLFFLLISCEGESGGDGKVYNKETGFPIDSVMYKCVETGEVKYTDTLGNWEMYGPFGSCISDCPDFNVEFSKIGYKKQTLKNPDKDIYLEIE